MNRIIATIFGLLVAVLLSSTMLFIVNQTQFAAVFALGEIKEIKTEPGLYFKLPPPFQNVQYFDKRILTIDTPDAERVQTSEKKNLAVDSFIKWRIVDPKLFVQSFQGIERAAEDRITALVRDSMQQAINRRTVNDVTSRERDKIMEEVRGAVQERIKDLGVEVVDVRLKRVDFVPEISESVFNRMKAERNRVANEQRSTGAAEGEKIRADAERQREVILAEAYRDAQKLKGEGDAKASAVYASAFSTNPEFFSFYRSLEAYRNTFKGKSDVIVLDPSSEFFRYLKDSGGKK
ncbi:MAG: protease modulator HflC [Burkholderiaceae bacterium]